MEITPRYLRIYQSEDGKFPFIEWIKNLRDLRGKQKIEARLDRLRLGNMGDTRSVGAGVTELRIQFGPGYRVYFGQESEEITILLMGGDKGSQDEDIKKAKEFWKSHKKQKDYANR